MKKLTFALGMVLSGGLAQAAVAEETAVQGDIEAGKTKSEQVCKACHGEAGNSMIPNFPKLAGQHASYILGQLRAFKDGGRQDPSMSPMSAPLSEADMLNVAAYFSSQAPSPGTASKDLAAQGAKVYQGGNPATGAMACMACHGPTGSGNPPAGYPMLRGQHPAYIVKQLDDFKAGKRPDTPASKIMRDIASRLSPEEMKAVAEYIAGLY